MTLLPLWIILGAILLFYSIRAIRSPSHDREWCLHHALLPTVTIDHHGIAHVRHVRHARYNSEFDFDLEYTDEAYNIYGIRNVWLYVSHWDRGQAHCILSFEFDDGRFLASSVEVRKTHAHEFKVQDVLYGNFEIFYILADERDVVALRSHIWTLETSDLYLYRLTLTPEQRQKTFRAMADRINHFSEVPRWYRVTYRNCATEPMRALRLGGAQIPRWDWRFSVAGFIDRALYDYHLIDTSRPFSDTYKAADITQLASTIPLDDEFEVNIRKLLQHQK